MAKLNRAAEAAPIIPSAKVHQEKDIAKVLAFFRYKVGTSLDCALHINRLRNSVTWYIKALEEMGLLQAIFKAKDQHTGTRLSIIPQTLLCGSRNLSGESLTCSGKEVRYERI